MEYTLEYINEQIEQLLPSLSPKEELERYKKLHGLIDLTTLKTEDNARSIQQFCGQVNNHNKLYPYIPNVAAVCVFPNMVEYTKASLQDNSISIASVVGGFPSSQTFFSIQLAEIELAIEKGANEIDLVANIGAFLEGNYQQVGQEISIIKQLHPQVKLKVILECGLYPQFKDLEHMAMLVMEAGADFIKTSTGKEGQVARKEDVFVMIKAIEQFYKRTGKKVGLKPAGGLSTPQQALEYFQMIENTLGTEWLNSKLFRLGASRLSKALIAVCQALKS